MLQGNLYLPPGGAACPSIPHADLLLCLPLEEVQKNHFLLMLRQKRQGGGKNGIAQQDSLTADSKRIVNIRGWLCKVFICGTEWVILLVHQIVKGDFPLPAFMYPPGCVYGCVANDNPAKSVVSVLDMLFVFFKLGHGKSPFLNDVKGRQHSLLSPLDYPIAKTGGAVNGGRSPFILTVDCSGWFCYLFQ